MSKALIEITGFEELQAKLKQLPDRVKKREMLKILGQVANPTVQAMRLEAPQSDKPHLQSGRRTRKLIQPGNLKRSIGKIIGRKGKAKENPTLYVGPKTKGNKNDGWYGNFVHYGTKRGQKPNPFSDRAYQITEGRVSDDAEKQVAKYIQKQIDRLGNV